MKTEPLKALLNLNIPDHRYNDPNKHKRFVLGVDRSKMRLFDVDMSEQNLVEDTPAFDNSNTNERFKDFKIN